MLNSGLIRLFVVRTASRVRLALLLLALALLAYVSPPAEWLLRIAEDAEQARHAFALQTIWSGSLWLVIPIVLLHAARLPSRWRGVESGWIASRPNGRMRVVCSAWLGTWFGATLLVGVVFVGAELGAGKTSAATAWKHAGEFVGPARGIVPAAGVHWTLDEGEAGRLARIQVALAPGEAPFADARFTAQRGEHETHTEATLIARGELELELPSGTGPIEFELTRIGTGATLVVRDSRIDFFSPATSRFDASASIFAHAVLTLGALIAVALGLGSWLGTGYAFALLLSAWLGFWFQPGGASWLPGNALPGILAELHTGRAPLPPTLTAWLGALGCTAWGYWLCRGRVRNERGNA